MTKRIFIDSNIFLNFLLKEEGSYEGSKHLLTRIEKGDMEGVTTLIIDICISNRNKLNWFHETPWDPSTA